MKNYLKCPGKLRLTFTADPFLPSSLQCLDVLARGEMPSCESSDLSVSTLFERRTADAFQSLGFEMQPLGQGTGRNPDSIALANKERYAILIDAKVRANGYTLGTEDRKFLEYALKPRQRVAAPGLRKSLSRCSRVLLPRKRSEETDRAPF